MGGKGPTRFGEGRDDASTDTRVEGGVLFR